MKPFLVFVVAISAVQCSVHAASPLCDTNILKQCTTLESIMTFNQWPRDLADVNNMCKLLKEGTNCVEEFNSNCVQNTESKKIAYRIWIALLSRYYDICDEDVDKQAFLQRVQCYANQNAAKNITEFHHKYVRLVETAHADQPHHKLPRLGIPKKCKLDSILKTLISRNMGPIQQELDQLQICSMK